MEISSLYFYSIYLLHGLAILGAHGVNIQLYEHANFTGLVWESTTNRGCNNIPEDKQPAVRSIRTDTCFIAYYNLNCKSYRTEKYLPKEIILSASQLGWIESVQTCNEEEGGNQLNLDITKYYRSTYIVPAVLLSYKNVCSCVNIPQSVQNMYAWSIDNHHNDLLAYYEPECSVNKWNPKLIPAGYNRDSRYMRDHRKTDPATNTTYKIQSFGPDPNSTYFQTSNCKLEILASKIVETQVEQLKRNQEKFQNEMLQKHNDDFKKLREKFTELEQECRNVTHKVKSDVQIFFCLILINHCFRLVP